MLISKKMNAALNEQVGHEFGASLQYVEIAAYFSGEGLNRLAGHFFKQSAEERDHALRLVKYVLDAGGEVQIPALPAPRSQFKTPVDAVQAAIDWELEVTKQISALTDLAIKESDHLTRETLGWFLTEQVEEVSSMENLLKLVQRAGNNLLYVENTLSGEKKESSAS
ncbi:MAG: ferritin [Verrucomicrobia bacterium]|nr:ferritin [Verrucomicrobiota bacterium]